MTQLKLEKTKLADDYGRPICFYHTTDVAQNITHFHPLTHFGTQQAAQMRGIHLAYKILGMIEPNVLPSELPPPLQKKLNTQHPNALKTYPVYLHIKCPIPICDFGKHDLLNYQGWFTHYYSPKSIYLTPKECRERDTAGVERMAYKQALNEFIFQNPKKLSSANLKKELEAERLFSSDTDNTSDLIKNVSLQRMMRYLESEGYDGFVYKNDCEDIGQKSYIIFRPEQVFQKGETAHEIPAINKENQQFLHKIEDDFFEAKGILSPYKRRELNRQIRAKRLTKTK